MPHLSFLILLQLLIIVAFGENMFKDEYTVSIRRLCSPEEARFLNSTASCINSDSRLPQPGGSGPCINIPQKQGRPVIPLGTGFPFPCLLWLAKLRWRYLNPPSHRCRLPVESLLFTTRILPPLNSSWRQAPWDLNGPSTKHRFQQFLYRYMRIWWRGNVFTEPCSSSSHLFLLIKNLQPSDGRRSVVCFAAVA
jgi:hypothetical protein